MIIARFGEIFLKSKQVKKRFISQLVNNIQTTVNGRVRGKRLRIYIYPDNEEKAKEKLRKIFGVVSISPAKETKPRIEKIKKEALKATRNWEKGTFAVRAQRITKDYDFNSQDIEREIGAAIQKQTDLEVDLDNPNHVFYVELYKDKAHTFTEKIEAPRGLPLGVSGTIEAEIETEEDLIACWMMMKRGCIIKPVNKNSMDSKLKKTLDKWHVTNKKPDEEILGEVKGTTEVKETLKESKEREKPVYTPLIGLSEEKIEELKEKVFEDT